MDPDIELLRQWRDGDNGAGWQLLFRHFRQLNAYFRQRLPELDPDDLVQEVYTRMVEAEARDRFEGRSSLRTYLFRIARNVFREEVRRLQGERAHFNPLVDSMADLTGRTQSSLVAQDERAQLTLSALRSIPSEQQDVLELHYLFDMRTCEIAECLDIPGGTVRSRLQAGRRAAARVLAEALGLGGGLTPEQLEEALVQLRRQLWGRRS